MITNKIFLSRAITIELTEYDNGVKDASIDYDDCNLDVSFSIEKDKAIEIVNALKLHFGI